MIIFLPALYVALSDEHIRHGSSRLVRHSSTGRGYADSVSNCKLKHGTCTNAIKAVEMSLIRKGSD